MGDDRRDAVLALESDIDAAIQVELQEAEQALKSARIARAQCSIPAVVQAVRTAAASMARVGNLERGAPTAKALDKFEKWIASAGAQMTRADALIKEARALLFPAPPSGAKPDGALLQTEARSGHPSAARQVLTKAREALYSLFDIDSQSPHQPPQADEMIALLAEIDKLARIEEEVGEAGLKAMRQSLDQGRLEDARREHEQSKLAFLRAGVEKHKDTLSCLLAELAAQETAVIKGSEKLPQVEPLIHARRLVSAQELLQEALELLANAHIDMPMSDNHHLREEVDRLQAVIGRVKSQALLEYEEAAAGIELNLHQDKLADADRNLKVDLNPKP